jgi:DNA gyrase/topoisomerase IV subunit B
LTRNSHVETKEWPLDESGRPTPSELSPIESVRKRVSMYIGNTDFIGFLQYLVCPVALLLKNGPTRVAVAVVDGGFVIESDAATTIEPTSGGDLVPFESASKGGPGHGFDGVILAALSERLTVEIRREGWTESLSFRRGVRESHRHEEIDGIGGQTTKLTLQPDLSVFSSTNLSLEVFKSYLRRLSYLHRGVRFSVAVGGETLEYHAERGIVDLFDCMSASFQILHEPIHFVAEDGELRMEVIFAYQSWTERALHCFINNGRAVEGGTHEKGLGDALNAVHRQYLPTQKRPYGNGVVGVVSIRYPGAVWEGCIKSRIWNPELRGMVKRLFAQGVAEWLQSRPDVAEQLRTIQTFQFPDFLYE